jgi:hypothetical protein
LNFKPTEANVSGPSDAAAEFAPPYHLAIQRIAFFSLAYCWAFWLMLLAGLKDLPSQRSARDKLTCLVESGVRLVDCVNTFWGGRVDPVKLVV